MVTRYERIKIIHAMINCASTLSSLLSSLSSSLLLLSQVLHLIDSYRDSCSGGAGTVSTSEAHTRITATEGEEYRARFAVPVACAKGGWYRTEGLATIQRRAGVCGSLSRARALCVSEERLDQSPPFVKP